MKTCLKGIETHEIGAIMIAIVGTEIEMGREAVIGPEVDQGKTKLFFVAILTKIVIENAAEVTMEQG